MADTDMNTVLQRLVDEAAIRDTIARAGVVSSVRDTAGFRALWSADGVWSIGAPHERTADGVDAVVEMFEQLWDANDYFFQSTTPGAVEIDGDTSTSRSLCQEFAKGPNGRYYRTTGVWTDQLRRDGARWVFTRRSWQYLWLDVSPFGGDTFAVTLDSA